MNVRVRLTNQEMAIAAISGVLRRVSAIQRSRPEVYGHASGDLWGIDIESCAAEMAVAKYVDRFWSPLASGALRNVPEDVGGGIQVRSTPRADGKLIIHDRDTDSQCFWLVTTNNAPVYTLCGWIYGWEAKREEFWWDTERPAFFVPQSQLHDPGTAHTEELRTTP